MAAPSKAAIWAQRIGKLSLLAAIIGLILPAIGLTLARYDVVDKMPGFQTLIYGGMLALGAVVLAVVALIISIWGEGSGRKSAIIGGVLAAPLLIFLANGYNKAKAVPPIHDVTTSLANPPQFSAITLREDNLAGVETVAKWQDLHAAAYPDIKPLSLSRAPSEVIADVQRLAEERDWEIVDFDPDNGRLEAIAFVSYIRFRDDVVVLVAPSADGSGSTVNMRSVSEVGVSDLGVNAARIRDFFAALEASAGSGAEAAERGGE